MHKITHTCTYYVTNQNLISICCLFKSRLYDLFSLNYANTTLI